MSIKYAQVALDLPDNGGRGMKLWQRLFRKNSPGRFALVCLIPFILFGVDFRLSPVLFDTRVGNDTSIPDVFRSDSGTLREHDASIAGVFRHGSLSMGTLRGHHFFVSLDDIRDNNFASHITKGKTALVVTMFGDNNDGYLFGPLSLAVLSRLQSLSGDDYFRFKTIPDQLRGSEEGSVNNLELRIPTDRYRSFPLDSLLIASVSESPDADSLRLVFKRAFALADEHRIDNVVVPNLGLKWRNSKGAADVPLPDYFKALFDGVQAGQHPNSIFVSLYKAWPTPQLEEVVAALDSQWDSVANEQLTPLPLHNKNTRLLLGFLLLCLISSGLATELTVLRVVIIVVGFFAAGFGAIELTEKITVAQSEEIKLFATLVVLATLSLLFPIFASLEVKDIFRRTPD
jgi:hypothetical protein